MRYNGYQWIIIKIVICFNCHDPTQDIAASDADVPWQLRGFLIFNLTVALNTVAGLGVCWGSVSFLIFFISFYLWIMLNTDEEI